MVNHKRAGVPMSVLEHLHFTSLLTVNNKCIYIVKIMSKVYLHSSQCTCSTYIASLFYGV